MTPRRFHRTLRFGPLSLRCVALLVVFFFTGSLFVPVLAQSTGDRGGTYLPEGWDEAQYIDSVRSRAALKGELENRWAEGSARSKVIRARLEQLERARPPAGVSRSDWYERRDAEIAHLRRYLRQNDQAIRQYRQQLGKIYGDLDRDRKNLHHVRDEIVRQELGGLVGVGGIAAAPIWSRPTLGKLGGAIKHGIQTRQLASVTSRISAAQTRSAGLAEAAANAKPPVRNSWSVHTEGGRVLLRGANGKSIDMGAATRKSASGEAIRNDSAFRKANYYSELYAARSNISHNLEMLKFQRSQARNAKVRANLDKQITRLETKQAELQRDISKYREQNPNTGSTLKRMAGSAAKWAAFSVGITVASNAIHQLTRNGWDPSRIDWGAAIAPLKTPDFWGGTAGSFGLSMLASAIVPGGAFLKTFAAIGGAAVGWQLGSGNLFDTDWTELGVTTTGATVGVLIGTALGGPVGAFLGGIVGNLVSSWLLGKVREWLQPDAQSWTYSDLGTYTRPGAPPPQIRRPDFGDDPRVREYGPGDLARLRQAVDQAYLEMMDYSQVQGGPGMIQFERKRREYMALKSQLEALQRGAQVREDDYREGLRRDPVPTERPRGGADDFSFDLGN